MLVMIAANWPASDSRLHSSVMVKWSRRPIRIFIKHARDSLASRRAMPILCRKSASLEASSASIKLLEVPSAARTSCPHTVELGIFEKWSGHETLTPLLNRNARSCSAELQSLSRRDFGLNLSLSAAEWQFQQHGRSRESAEFSTYRFETQL